MAKFSERIGMTEPFDSIQTNSMNNNLKNSIWNLLLLIYGGKLTRYEFWYPITDYIALNYTKMPLDTLPRERNKWFRDYYYELNWYEVYNLIEFIVNEHDIMAYQNVNNRRQKHELSSDFIEDQFNIIFERESSAYHFIKKILTPISNEIEVQEIKEILVKSNESGFSIITEHLEKALKLLSLKPDPDYHNSIKESISSVESIISLITGTKPNGLDKGMIELKKRLSIHSALSEGFKKLYGYTSEEDGIRHAFMEKSDVGFVEAKYMLVSCSAFANYLIHKAEQAGLFNK